MGEKKNINRVHSVKHVPSRAHSRSSLKAQRGSVFSVFEDLTAGMSDASLGEKCSDGSGSYRKSL